MEWTMQREKVLLASGIVCFLLPTFEVFWLGFNWFAFFWILVSFAASGLAMVLILYLPISRIGTVSAGPELVRWHLAHEIRLSQHEVTESWLALKVRVDSISGVEILLKGTPKGTTVSYRAGATEAGWGAITIPLIFLWFSFLTGFTAPWIYLKSVRFVRKYIAPLLPADGVLRQVVSYDDIGARLMAHAAEDHRLFSQAYQADRDTYWDALGIVGVLAFFGWFLLFMILNVTSTNPDYMARISDALLPSIAIILAIAIPSIWLVRKIFKPRMMRWKNWLAKIDEVWRTEATRSTPDDSAPSSFEVLSEAAKEAPLCLRSVRKAGLNRDFATWTALFWMIWIGFYLAARGFMWLVMSWTGGLSTANAIFAVSEFGAGIAFLVGAWVYYDYWKRRQEEILNRELANWNSRHEELRRRMESFLQELQSDG